MISKDIGINILNLTHNLFITINDVFLKGFQTIKSLALMVLCHHYRSTLLFWGYKPSIYYITTFNLLVIRLIYTWYSKLLDYRTLLIVTLSSLLMCPRKEMFCVRLLEIFFII